MYVLGHQSVIYRITLRLKTLLPRATGSPGDVVDRLQLRGQRPRATSSESPGMEGFLGDKPAKNLWMTGGSPYFDVFSCEARVCY